MISEPAVQLVDNAPCIQVGKHTDKFALESANERLSDAVDRELLPGLVRGISSIPRAQTNALRARHQLPFGFDQDRIQKAPDWLKRADRLFIATLGFNSDNVAY